MEVALLQIEEVRLSVNIVEVEVVVHRVMVLATNTIHTVIMKTSVHHVMEVNVALTVEELVDRDRGKAQTIRIL